VDEDFDARLPCCSVSAYKTEMLWVFLFAQSASQVAHTLTRSQLRWEFASIAIGVTLVFAGLLAASLFLLRSRTRERTLIYFSVFSTLYGIRLLIQQSIVRALWDLPRSRWELFGWLITCTILLPLSLFLYELADQPLKTVLRWVLAIQATLAIIGVAGPIAGVPLVRLQPLNHVVVLGSVAVGLIYLVWNRTRPSAQPLSHETRVLLSGFAAWFLLIIHTNLHDLGLLPGNDKEPIGFLIFVGALAYVSAGRIFSAEEHLLAINKELDIARQIQSSTLPREVPSFRDLEIAARYQPMSAVAGDFYDFLVVDEHRVGILVADVTGHGVPAALIASMLKVAFSAQADHAADPARVLNGLNRALCGKFEEHFVTAAYVFVDAERNVLRYAGAGHPPLLLASPAPGDVRLIEENGLMLGLFPEAEYLSTEIALKDGDRCLLYTDGVFEAMNATQQEFGRPRLMEFLRAHSHLAAESFTKALLAEVSRWASHSTGPRQGDDITVLALDFRRHAIAETS
jgi:phosphoserine phosphatase RsbU/P